MIVFPHCKINLGLHITGKRSDGYHDLETVFYPVPFTDALEIVEDIHPDPSPIRFTATGPAIPGDTTQNLCVKAYQLLKKDFPQLPPVKMHLHKKIPLGAGLGGGSSNGVFALMLLNKKFELGLSETQLINYALQLGSDCPFFIISKPCFATGRGEVMVPIDLSLKGYYLVLVNPGIHISTREAFSIIRPGKNDPALQETIMLPVTKWKDQLANDFEAGVFENHSAIALLKKSLYEAGAVYAAMTGTGSTVYGLFENRPSSLPNIAPGTWVETIGL